MRFIELTQEKTAVVDDEDFAYLNQFSWQAQKSSGSGAYVVWHAFTNLMLGFKKKQMRVGMHRLIWARMNNDPAFLVQGNKYIDHIDFNGLNNSRLNIRACSNTENQIHKRLQRNNKSGFRGVTLNKQHNTWVVRFVVPGGGRVYGGTFKTSREAALVYNEKALKYFGKFAVLNEV